MDRSKRFQKRRLLRVNAWVLRFIRNYKAKGQLRVPYLTTSEVKEPEARWTKEV